MQTKIDAAPFIPLAEGSRQVTHRSANPVIRGAEWMILGCILTAGIWPEPARCSEKSKPAAAPASISSIASPLTHAIVRQTSHGDVILSDHLRRVVLVKSNEDKAHNLLGKVPVGQIGATALNFELGPQANVVKPYLESGVARAAHFGKGIVTGRGSTRNEFEFDLLPGTTAGVTVYEGQTEILIPLNPYLPSVDAQLDQIEPVLLKLGASEKDGSRVVSIRSVTIKENKKDRFQLKVGTERQEGAAEETPVPITVTRLPGNVVKAVSKQPLTTGEYALIFRQKTDSGQNAKNVALRSSIEDNAAGHFSETKQNRQRTESPSVGLLAFDFRVIPGSSQGVR